MVSIEIVTNVLFIIAVMGVASNVAYVSWMKKSKKTNVIAILVVGTTICLLISYMYWSVIDM